MKNLQITSLFCLIVITSIPNLYSNQFSITLIDDIRTNVQQIRHLRLSPLHCNNFIDRHNVIIIKKNNGNIIRTDDWGMTWYPYQMNSIDQIKIKIHPNPAHECISIFVETDCNESTEVEIFDIYGVTQTLQDIKTNNSYMIDVNNFKKGIYFLKYKDSKHNIVTKFVKN